MVGESESGREFQIFIADGIPAARLLEEGSDLRKFFPSDRSYSVDGNLSESLREVSATGWRVIREVAGNDRRGEMITVAAPATSEPGSWVLISFARAQDGRWVVSTGGESFPYPAVPSRGERRRNLHLELGETTAAVGSTPRIRPTLTNVGDSVWHNVADDYPSVYIWVLNSNGDPIASPGYRLWTPPAHTLPDLKPGETIELDDIEFITDPSIETFTKGTYKVVGVLQDLKLRSEPGILHVM